MSVTGWPLIIAVVVCFCLVEVVGWEDAHPPSAIMQVVRDAMVSVGVLCRIFVVMGCSFRVGDKYRFVRSVACDWGWVNRFDDWCVQDLVDVWAMLASDREWCTNIEGHSHVWW